MDVECFTLERRRGEGESAFANVRAGRSRIERIVPPAGEGYAFDRKDWTHDFQIYVSPSGRSVRLFLNGEEIELPKGRKL
jgi:hypothetical protein